MEHVLSETGLLAAILYRDGECEAIALALIFVVSMARSNQRFALALTLLVTSETQIHPQCTRKFVFLRIRLGAVCFVRHDATLLAESR